MIYQRPAVNSGHLTFINMKKDSRIQVVEGSSEQTKDVGFIFFVMVVGMACGTKFYPVAIITTFVGCGLVYFMTYSNFGQKGLAQDILEMYFPITEDYAKVLSPIFIRHLKYYSLLSVDSVDDKTNRLSFIVTFKTKLKLLTFKILKISRESRKGKYCDLRV